MSQYYDTTVFDIAHHFNNVKNLTLLCNKRNIQDFGIMINTKEFADLQVPCLTFESDKGQDIVVTDDYLNGVKPVDYNCHFFTLLQLTLLNNNHIHQLRLGEMNLPVNGLYTETRSWNMIFQHIKSITFTNVSGILNMHRMLFLGLPLLEYYKEDCLSGSHVLVDAGLVSAISKSKCKKIYLSMIGDLCQDVNEKDVLEVFLKCVNVKRWSDIVYGNLKSVNSKKMIDNMYARAIKHKRRIKNISLLLNYYTVTLE
jgi:hypothetical protein